MTIDMIHEVLGWCTVINMGILLLWFSVFVFNRDWIYRMHSKWFDISIETFSSIHYAGIAFFKILVLVFNVIPYIALRIVG